MPSIGNIVLADGQGTPVNHTFQPIFIDAAGVAFFEDTTGGIPLGYGRLSISLKRPASNLQPGSNSSSAVYRAKIKVEAPTLEVTSPSTGSGIQPAPTISYTCVADMVFVMPARSSLQNRKDIVAYAKNALGHATVQSVLHDLNAIY
jgi:hypothetical protein